MVIFGYTLSVLDLVFAGILLFSLLFSSVYYSFIFLRLGLYKNKKRKEKTVHEAVSVVVYTRDQAYKLKENLFYLLEQEYPNFEVIIINHASQDDTNYVVRVFSETYKNLKIIDLQLNINVFQGKKYPLSIGIKCAKNDIILLTDAESIPKSYHWISEMEKQFTKGVQIVLGYVTRQPKVPFFNYAIQYDYASEAASYLGFALLKCPYMGLGENMAYRRSFFFDKKGFIKHYSIPDGDDALFVNQNSNSSNTHIAFHSDAFVTTHSPVLLKDWIRQRKNRISIFFHFKSRDQFLQSMLPVLTILYYAAFVILYFNKFPYPFLLSTLFVKFAWQIFSFYMYSKKIELKKVFIFVPLFELFFIFFDAFLFVSILMKKIFRWK